MLHYIYIPTVFLCLLQVSSELVAHAERSPGFQFNLREVRKRMVGQETSDLLRCVCVYTHMHCVCMCVWVFSKC